MVGHLSSVVRPRGPGQGRPADVSPGRWGTQIVFCKPVSKVKANDDGEKVEDKFWILRSYTVFNLDQVDGLDHLRAGNTRSRLRKFIDDLSKPTQ